MTTTKNNQSINPLVDEKLINEADKIGELIPFLETISLKKIQKFIITEINNQHDLHGKLSINKSLPDDILSFIFSFLNSNPRLFLYERVCKKWQQLSHIKYTNFVHRNNSNANAEHSNTWICNYKRVNKKLTSLEIKLNIKGIESSIQNIINSTNFKPGDFIFYYSGYEESSIIDYGPSSLLEITDDCTIFGVGQTTELGLTHFGNSDHKEEFENSFISIGSKDGRKPCTVTIEGINFNFKSNFYTWMNINPGSTVTISNCKFAASCIGIAHKGKDLHINSSYITVGGYSVLAGYHTNFVCINESKLINTYIPHASCIKFIQNQEANGDNIYQNELVKLKCSNNIFVSNVYPITKDRNHPEYKQLIPLTMTHTKWFKMCDSDEEVYYQDDHTYNFQQEVDNQTIKNDPADDLN